MLESEEVFKRILWDKYFINLLGSLVLRSTCRRRQTSAIIVKNNRIIATGYNGQPPGFKHCTELGFCLREKLKIPSGQRAEICRAVHAEENAILQVTNLGESLKNSTIYMQASPCSYCTKSILSVGISRVVYLEIYPDDLAVKLREEATWVEWEKYQPPKDPEKNVSLYADEQVRSLEKYPSYWISNYGRVFKDMVLDEDSTILDTGIWIEPNYDSSLGKEVVLKKQRGRKYTRYVAVLVAETWLENPHNYSCVTWRNGNKDNCHKDNLEWIENDERKYSTTT